MFILGLQGSPRKKGNTAFLLKSFLDAAESAGAVTRTIEAARVNVLPCRGCGYCEKKGYCVIKDDEMTHEIYPLLKSADMIVAASPVFFYGVSAQLKALIDRSQALWSRKYVLKLKDPAAAYRKGILLSVGATRGKQLFDGIRLTAKYFFDAVSAEFSDSLTYTGIEYAGEMEKHPSFQKDIEQAVETHVRPLLKRKKVLFACRENACRSQMAAAFAQHHAGNRIEAISCGSTPADQTNPMMREVMKEKNLDMAFRRPMSMDEALAHHQPHIMVTMGCGEQCPHVPGAEILDWDLPDPANEPIEFMRNVRDEIEQRVLDLIKNIID